MVEDIQHMWCCLDMAKHIRHVCCRGCPAEKQLMSFGVGRPRCVQAIGSREIDELRPFMYISNSATVG